MKVTSGYVKVNAENKSPKRKKFREIAFHEDPLPVLKKRIREVKEGKLLDYNNYGNLGRAIKRYLAEDLEITEQYSAGTFRKTFITLCWSRYNMDASVVREIVGHEQGNTTDKYYNQISVDRMKEELKKFVRPIVKKKQQ